jgi:putative transposase
VIARKTIRGLNRSGAANGFQPFLICRRSGSGPTSALPVKRKRHTEKQIIAILKSTRAGMKTDDSEASFYNWKAKYGGLEVSEAKRLKGLESENAKLKKLLADAMLDNAALKDLLAKKW